MKRTTALTNLLGDLTRVFHDKRVPVEFTKGPSSAAMDGSHVKVCTNLRKEYGLRDATDVQELRVMVDHLSHEIEHLRETDLESKKAFVDEYKESHPAYANVAGFVINVLEDVFIDGTRTRRFPGLRASHAYFIDTQVSSGDHVGASLPLPRRLLAGFWEVSHAGTARGIEKAEPEVQEALAKVRLISQEIRHVTNPQDRYALAHEAMAVLLDVLPDEPTEQDQEDIERAINVAPTDDLPEGSEPEPAGDQPAPEDGEDGEAGEDGADGDGDGGDGEGEDEEDGGDAGSSRSLEDLLGDADPADAVIVSR